MRPAIYLTFSVYLLLPFTACDSPTDVSANRIRSIDIEDDPNFCAVARKMFTCPGTNDDLLFVAFKHADTGTLKREGNTLSLFHDHANVEIIHSEKGIPVFMKCAYDPRGSAASHEVFFAEVQFPDDISPENRLAPELRVVSNGTFATTVEIGGPHEVRQYGEGTFPQEFGDIPLGVEIGFHISCCQYCTEDWILESVQLDDPAGLFELDFPPLPLRIGTMDEFSAVVTFELTEALDYQATVTLDFRTESGYRFQTIYPISGRGV